MSSAACRTCSTFDLGPEDATWRRRTAAGKLILVQPKTNARCDDGVNTDEDQREGDEPGKVTAHVFNWTQFVAEDLEGRVGDEQRQRQAKEGNETDEESLDLLQLHPTDGLVVGTVNGR